MKTILSLGLPLWLALLFIGCAGMTPYKESVLIEAGFQPVPASSAGAYATLPPYDVQRVAGPGRPVYAYRNENKGITYTGGEAEYQRYEALLQKKGRERIDIVNRQMNQDSLHFR